MMMKHETAASSCLLVWVFIWNAIILVNVGSEHGSGNGNGVIFAYALHMNVPPSCHTTCTYQYRYTNTCNCVFGERQRQRDSSMGTKSNLSLDRLAALTYRRNTRTAHTRTRIGSCIHTTESESAAKTTTKRTKPTTTTTLHLISLPPLIVSDKPESCTPKIVRDLWKWKDIVLGDGRDYFIPKPRALKALSDVLIGSSSCENEDIHMVHTIQEAAILSNCARLDVLVALQSNNGTTCSDEHDSQSNEHETEAEAETAAKFMVADCLLNQLEVFQKRRADSSGNIGRATLMEGF